MCLIKLEQKHASKDGIELAIFKAFREFLLAVRFLGLWLALLLLVHSVIYGNDSANVTQTHANTITQINELN